ncbi:MAG: hypothetical protein GF349_00840 [Candidatus Magasanikbacteria bacterium]|nr:hypothetical protein [Candidatus Magasanikbacteria bacterium]
MSRTRRWSNEDHIDAMDGVNQKRLANEKRRADRKWAVRNPSCPDCGRFRCECNTIYFIDEMLINNSDDEFLQREFLATVFAVVPLHAGPDNRSDEDVPDNVIFFEHHLFKLDDRLLSMFVTDTTCQCCGRDDCGYFVGNGNSACLGLWLKIDLRTGELITAM